MEHLVLTNLLNAGLALLGTGLGTGLVVLAAAYGIGKIGGAAMEAIARQPEAGGRVQLAMIIAAALIEGVSLFGVVVCLMIATRTTF
jgi:F-type H+-transporting ATPase subunit c